MTQETNQIEVPNLAATSDGKSIFTPKQWLERFRQYTKRNYKIDIAELIRGADITQNGWTEKENEIQEDFIWGIGPEALHQMTRAEYKTDPDKTKIKDLIRLFNDIFFQKEIRTIIAEILLDQTVRNRNTGRLLKKNNINR